MDTSTITIDAGIPILIDNIESVAPGCKNNDGSILIIPNGGTGQIMYSIDGITYQNSNLFSNLGPGLYSVSLIDEAACTASGTFEITDPNSISIQNIITQPSECGKQTGSVMINVIGGTGQITISLDGGPALSNYSIQNLGAGDYMLTLTDEKGCSIDTSVQIGQLRCEIYIPNTFSPNQDGVNDFFQLFTSDNSNIHIQKYLIFDRWGNLVYSANDFPISSTEHWWDGTFKRLSMGPGVYAYYIEVAYDNGDNEIFKGSVTLIK
jgi:gliding motility-associated-like protein